MFKKYWFKKHTYPLFKKQLKNVENEKVIMLWQNEDNSLNIIMVLEHTIIIFKKEKNKDILKNNIILPAKLSDNNINIPVLELKEYVLQMKTDGIIIDSQHIVEFINNNLRNCIQYYGLKRSEVVEIFNEILIKNKTIFKNNPPATVIENMANKWID